jgi:hypothetical protein
MLNLQKAGGAAALFEAFAYIVGIAVMATLMNPGDTSGWDAVEKLDFVLERKSLFHAWTLLIYAGFGIALVALAVALHERLAGSSSSVMKIATPFGLIWSGLVIASGMVASVGLESVATLRTVDADQAVTNWALINVVQDGLGGGVEVVGGVWVLLISIASLGNRALPKGVTYLGFVVGAAGVLTILPPLKDMGLVFGLTQIAWFAWIGVHLLRMPGSVPGQ